MRPILPQLVNSSLRTKPGEDEDATATLHKVPRGGDDSFAPEKHTESPAVKQVLLIYLEAGIAIAKGGQVGLRSEGWETKTFDMREKEDLLMPR